MADPPYKSRWDRFFIHWFFNTVGILLNEFLPIIEGLEQGIQVSSRLQWLVIRCAAIALVGGGINSSIPYGPTEMLKSIASGFTLNSTFLYYRESNKRNEILRTYSQEILQIAYDLAAQSKLEEAIKKAETIQNLSEVSDIYQNAQTKIQEWQELINTKNNILNARKTLQTAYDLAAQGQLEEAIKTAKTIQNLSEVSDIYQNAQTKIQEWQELINRRNRTP